MSQRLRTLLLLVLFTLMASVGLFGLLLPAATKAATGINNSMNFQGRLLNAAGATVADGYYNMQFKIYQDGTGTATSDPGGTLLWTENWVYASNSPDSRVHVVNGYFSVQLGALCPMNSTSCTAGTGNSQTNTIVNFNSDTLWLSVNIGDTSNAATFSTASGDGEMTPMKRLAANAYAFNAGQLQGIAASGFGQLAANNTYTGTNRFQNTNSAAFSIQNAGGSLTAFSANTSTGTDTIYSLLQSASGTALDLESGGSAAVTIGTSINTTAITLGHGSVGVTIPASSSLTLGAASSATGAILFKNATNANTLTLQSGATAAPLSYTFTLPTADGSSGNCLETNGSGALNFGSCTGGISAADTALDNLSSVAINTSLLPGSGVTVDLGSGSLPFGNLYLFGSSSTPTSNNFELTGASSHGTEVFNLPDKSGTSTVCVLTSGTQSCPTSLQTAYNNSTGGSTPEILLDSTRGGLDIQDAASTIGANLLNIKSSAGNNMFSVSNTGAVTIQQSTASTTALQVLNNAGTPASVLTADTLNNRVGVDVTYTAMSAVGTVTPSAITNTSTFASGTFYYKVTAIDATGGETAPSAEVSQAVSGTTQSVQLSWAAVAGANGYRIYRGTVSNSESGYYSTLGSISSSTVTFIDTNASMNNTTATPPSTNSAYISANVTNNSLQITVGGNGTPTGQLYVSGTAPATAIGGLTVTPSGGETAIVANGRFLYAVGTFTSNATIDVSTPTSPSVTGTGSSVIGGPSVVDGKYLYSVGGGFASLGVYDVSSSSAAPASVTNVTLTDSGQAIASQGRYLFVTEGTTSGYLQAFDAGSTKPLSLGTGTATGNSPVGISVAGQYAYVVNNGSSTLQIFDVSNPSSIPAAVGSVSTTGAPNAITVAGKYAYVLEGTTTGLMQIFDISNPAAPVSVGSVSTGQTPSQVAVAGRYVYVANSTSTLSLQAFDISNPTNPAALAASSPLAGAAKSMVIQGRYAYVLEASTYLQIFDIGGAYTQSLETGTSEFGSLTVDGNESINGNSSISGGLAVGQSLDVQGNLAVSGTLTPPNASALTEATTCTNLIPGAIYYNTTTNAVRTCQYNATTSTSNWTDMVTDQDLGLLAFGVMQESGANPGDLASVAGASGSFGVPGPCKVSWLSTTSVTVKACSVYSGGRKFNIADTTVTGLGVTGTAEVYHIFVNPATGTISKNVSTTETGSQPTFSVTAPIVTLADVKTSTTPAITNIYDTRVFTSDTKTAGTINATTTVGTVISQTGAGTVALATSNAATNIVGVIVATSGTATTTTLNIIYSTAGPAFIKSTGTSSVNSTIVPAASGYVSTGTTTAASTTAYNYLGVSELTISTSCSALTSYAVSCQYSQLTNLNIR